MKTKVKEERKCLNGNTNNSQQQILQNIHKRYKNGQNGQLAITQWPTNQPPGRKGLKKGFKIKLSSGGDSDASSSASSVVGALYGVFSFLEIFDEMNHDAQKLMTWLV